MSMGVAHRAGVVIVVGTLVSASCGGDDHVGRPLPSDVDATAVPPTLALDEHDGIDVIANVTERNTSPGANGQAVNGVVGGTNDFAVRFFQTAVGEPTGNAVVGNYSISTGLLMTMAGTRGATTDAFGRLLRVGDVALDELHPAVNALDLIIEGRARDELEISTANKLFVQQGLPLKDGFLDIATGSYGAPVGVVDFAGPPEEAAAAVNDWVAEQTHGFIDHLTDGYSPQTVVVLANAMYLKAAWSVQFRRLDDPGRFRTIDGRVVTVDLMAHDQYLPLNSGKGFVAVELPYVGGNLSMVVIQPKNLAAFEANLTAERLRQITDGLEESGIHLTMPIWSTTASIDALEPLQKMGLPATYDFGAMFDGGDEGYFIGSVTHKARIDVDEKGTTAAASTDVAILGSHGPTVEINRPFFYVIRDRGSGAILFLGHVTDPSATS